MKQLDEKKYAIDVRDENKRASLEVMEQLEKARKNVDKWEEEVDRLSSISKRLERIQDANYGYIQMNFPDLIDEEQKATKVTLKSA